MQGKNWANKKTGELAKELLMEHFGKILVALMLLLILLGLNGSLGETIDKVIDIWAEKEKPVQVQYIQAPPQQPTPPPTEEKQ